MIGAVWNLIIFASMVKRLISPSRNERVSLQVYDTCLQMFLFPGTAKKNCLTRSTFSSDTCGRPALFPVQRNLIVWNCLYQRLMLFGDRGITVELSPECSLNRNNWFVLHKLQHTKRLLLPSRHFLFVTSQTEREEGSGIAHAHKTWTPPLSFHMGNLLLCAFWKP
jgi:hypothetical protein